jgi:hypothetical protein
MLNFFDFEQDNPGKEFFVWKIIFASIEKNFFIK